jgi:TonB-dependent receptor
MKNKKSLCHSQILHDLRLRGVRRNLMIKNFFYVLLITISYVGEKIMAEVTSATKSLCASKKSIPLVASLCFSSAVNAGQALEQRYFEIKPQTMEQALLAYSEQSGVQILFNTERVKGLKCQGFTGHLTRTDAIKKLLNGSGLDFRFTAENTLTVQPTNQKKSVFKRNILAAVIGFFASAEGAYAQYDTTDEKSENGLVVEEVTVTGIRSSIKQALDMKREDSRVIDGISAEDIADFPDQNLAESIQRVTGVQLLRDPNTGRGSLISLRGLGPAYARTTLNGQTLAKPDLGSGFTFDFVQPEIASSVEVIKSPSADMDEGGLSGTININTVSPLDYDKRKVVVSGQTIYSEIKDDYTPKLNVAYIDQLMDGKLGVMANVGYHEVSSRYDIFFNQNHSDIDIDGDGVRPDYTANGGKIEFPSRNRYRRTDRDSERVLLNGALQYIFNDELSTKVSLTYVEEDVVEDQQQMLMFYDSDKATPLHISNAYVDYYTVTENRAEINWTRQDKEKDTGALTWETNWVRDDWEVDAVVHHTRSKDALSATGVQYTTLRTIDTTSDFRDRSNPMVTHSVDMNDPSVWDLSNVGGRHFGFGGFSQQKATENAFQIDVKRFIDVIPLVSAVKFGAKYRMQHMERAAHDFRGLSNDLDPAAPIPSVAEAPFYVKNFGNGEIDGLVTDWVMPDIDAYAASYAAAGGRISELAKPHDFYEVDRDILSVYTMLELEADRLRGNIGVRYVYTDKEFLVNEQSPNYITDPNNPGTLVSQGDENATRFTEGADYKEVLPSANIVFDITDDIIFRVAAAKVLVRPEAALGNQQYGTKIRIDKDRIETNVHRIRVDEGATDLKPLTANQFDASFEWYYDDASAISVGYFYKKVKNDLVREQYCPTSYGGIIDGLAIDGNGDCVDAGGSHWEIKRQFNRDGIVEINGGELGITHMFTHLPGPWSGLGVQANYSYLDVRVGSDENVSVDIAPETANLIAFYEWGGFAARVAFNYRDEYLQRSFFGQRVIQPRKQLDLSVSYQFTDNFRVALEGINVNNDNEIGYLLEKDNEAFQGMGVGGSTYQLAFKYQL